MHIRPHPKAWVEGQNSPNIFIRNVLRFTEIRNKDCSKVQRFFQAKGVDWAMSFLRVTAKRASIAGELLAFLWGNKRWWMVPMVLVLLIFGVLMLLAQSSAIAPFIYTLF